LANFRQNDVDGSAPKRIWAGKTSDEEILAGTLLVFGLEAQGDWAGLRGGNSVDTKRANFTTPAGAAFATDRISGDTDIIAVRVNYHWGGPVVAELRFLSRTIQARHRPGLFMQGLKPRLPRVPRPGHRMRSRRPTGTSVQTPPPASGGRNSTPVPPGIPCPTVNRR
jgi:hypothetical protein